MKLKDNFKERIFLRKNNSIIQYEKFNFDFFSYLFRRGVQVFLDVIVFIIIYFILKDLLKINFMIITIANMFASALFSFIIMMFSEGRSIGMLLTQLHLSNYNMSNLSKSSMFMRSTIATIYLLPFIGWSLLALGMITTFFTKGLSFIDVLTKNQILRSHQFKHYKDVFSSIENNKLKERSK